MSKPTYPAPQLLALVLPLFAELSLGIAVGVIGTVLAARQSDASAGAFALANHMLAMLFILFRIVGAGIGVVVAQSLGAGRRDQADAVARAALGASTWVGTLTAVAALFGAEPLLRALNAPAPVLPLAVPLLQGLAAALLLDAWNASLGSVTRAHLRVRDTLAVTLAMHAVHLLGALLLMPRFGLIGFAWAMAASRVLGLALHLLLWRARLGLVPRWVDWWRLQAHALLPVLRIGLPGAAENIAWRLCFMVSVAVAGQLGASALATQAYVLQVTHVALLSALAIGLAVEIVVGHLVGAGALHRAHALVRRALAWGLGLAVVISTLAALSGPWLMRQFTQDAAIIDAGVLLLWGLVLVEPGRCFNLVVINALRATGDARYPAAAGAASMVLVLGLGSWFLGLHLGWGLPGVWLAYAADEWIRGLLMWRRWHGRAWVVHARAAHRRLRSSTMKGAWT